MHVYVLLQGRPPVSHIHSWQWQGVGGYSTLHTYTGQAGTDAKDDAANMLGCVCAYPGKTGDDVMFSMAAPVYTYCGKITFPNENPNGGTADGWACTTLQASGLASRSKPILNAEAFMP